MKTLDRTSSSRRIQVDWEDLIKAPSIIPKQIVEVKERCIERKAMKLLK